MSTLTQEILMIKSHYEESKTSHNLEKDICNTYNKSISTEIILITPKNKF